MKRIIYIPFDHIHRHFGALKDANPKEDVPFLQALVAAIEASQK